MFLYTGIAILSSAQYFSVGSRCTAYTELDVHSVPFRAALRPQARSPWPSTTANMHGASQLTARLFGQDVIRAAFPARWDTTVLVVSLLALIVPSLVYLVLNRIRRMQVETKPFPFMELPPELRDLVYEHLVEDPHYPPPPACTKHYGSPLDWLLPGSSEQQKGTKESNWIFLANKQVYSEYMDIVCKRATFHLTVSPSNYTPEVASKSKKIWSIAPETFKQLRKCDIKLITTASMLGVSDPRNMRSDDWALARQMRDELKSVEKVQELNLAVKAIGDPLWNPLWVWYHATQSFKTMGTSEGNNDVAVGPKLNRITYSLDTWSPGENYLERDMQNKGQWMWRCTKGHNVVADGGAAVTVREFCAKLYEECRTCRPELESDEGED